MTRSYLRFLASANADQIVDALTDQQHLRPHQTVEKALQIAGSKVGFSFDSSQRALNSLQLSPTVAIGRLRRTQLIQLARAIGRHWRQTVAGSSTGVGGKHPPENPESASQLTQTPSVPA